MYVTCTRQRDLPTKCKRQRIRFFGVWSFYAHVKIPAGPCRWVEKSNGAVLALQQLNEELVQAGAVHDAADLSQQQRLVGVRRDVELDADDCAAPAHLRQHIDTRLERQLIPCYQNVMEFCVLPACSALNNKLSRRRARRKATSVFRLLSPSLVSREVATALLT